MKALGGREILIGVLVIDRFCCVLMDKADSPAVRWTCTVRTQSKINQGEAIGRKSLTFAGTSFRRVIQSRNEWDTLIE